MGRPIDIIAHRGASHDAPENTLAAVRLAWDRNADAVEVDIHLSRGGAVAVIHDANTARTAGVDGEVRDLAMAELKALDVGRWKGPRWAGEVLPTLDEILPLTPPGKRLLVEVKCGPEIIGPLGASLRDRRDVAERVAFCGFSDHTMKAVKKAFSRHEVYLISRVEDDERPGPPPGADVFVGRAREAGLDGLSLAACDTIDARFVERIRDAGLRLVVWTVDSLPRARQMVAAGVDGIATNRPGWLREHLGWADVRVGRHPRGLERE